MRGDGGDQNADDNGAGFVAANVSFPKPVLMEGRNFAF